MNSLGIVQWNSTRRDHPGNPGRVSGSGPVNLVSELWVSKFLGLYIVVGLILCFVYLPNLIIGTNSVL